MGARNHCNCVLQGSCEKLGSTDIFSNNLGGPEEHTHTLSDYLDHNKFLAILSSK